jgi:hypothetical protein
MGCIEVRSPCSIMVLDVASSFPILTSSRLVLTTVMWVSGIALFCKPLLLPPHFWPNASQSRHP